MKPNILYIITQGVWGGAERYVFDLAVNLADDFDITVAVGEPNGKSDLQKKIKNHESRIRVVELKHLVRPISPIHDILAIFELKNLYKKIQPDIIHLNSSKAGVLGSLAALNMRRSTYNTIYTVHGWVFNEPLPWLKKKIYTFLESITAKLKKRIIILSKADEASGKQQLRLENKKVALIPLGIDPPVLASKENARKRLSDIANISTEGQIVGTIANLYNTKGIDVLLAAVAQQKKMDHVRFVIIGDGPEKKNLQSFITDHQLDHVHLLGSIKNAAQYLPAFDLFVLPSKKEGTPYTILEAMAADVPIVATDVGGVREMIGENNDLLVPAQNPDALGKAIRHKLREKTEYRQRTVPTLDAMITKTKNLYQSLIRRPRP